MGDKQTHIDTYTKTHGQKDAQIQKHRATYRAKRRDTKTLTKLNKKCITNLTCVGLSQVWHDDLYMTFGSHGTRLQQRSLVGHTAAVNTYGEVQRRSPIWKPLNTKIGSSLHPHPSTCATEGCSVNPSTCATEGCSVNPSTCATEGCSVNPSMPLKAAVLTPPCHWRLQC